MAASAAAFLATAAGAQTVEFRGGGYVSVPTSTACQNAGWPPGSFYMNMLYRPANVGSNGSLSRLSFFFQHFAMNYSVQGDLTKTFKPVTGGGLRSSQYGYPKFVKMKKTGMTPRNVTAASQWVVLSGEIKGLDGVRGCQTGFRGTLPRRPF